jgi:hypothetical protein
MRKSRKITLGLFGLGLLITLTFASLSSCTPAGETIRDRINAFTTAVNNHDELGIKDCLDPSATLYGIANYAWWKIVFVNKDPGTISDFSTSGNTATVTYTASGGPYIFEMTENKGTFLSGTTYKIRKVSTSGTAVFY